MCVRVREIEDPGRSNGHDKAFDGSAESDHDAHYAVVFRRTELPALWKRVCLDPKEFPCGTIRRGSHQCWIMADAVL